MAKRSKTYNRLKPFIVETIANTRARGAVSSGGTGGGGGVTDHGARIADVPATGAYASISPFYVDQIEYDAESTAWQITPKGNDDEFDVATMQG